MTLEEIKELARKQAEKESQRLSGYSVNPLDDEDDDEDED